MSVNVSLTEPLIDRLVASLVSALAVTANG
jgi:hypothetical protein